jgi:hypothetical protein
MSEKAPLKNNTLIAEANRIRIEAIELAKKGDKEGALALIDKMPDTFDKDSARRDVDFYISKLS